MLTLGFRKSTLTNKSKEDHLRHWTLKRFLGDFYGQSMICELILALVALWLLVNSIKKNPKEKCPIDFFGLFYSKIFFIILLLFCLFWF